MNELASLFQKISKFNLQVTMVLNNNFIEPLNQFHKDSSGHNIKIFKELETLVTNLEKTKKAAKASRNNYYQLSSNAEKSESHLQLTLHKSNMSEKELAKEVQKNEQLKVFSQEARSEYEKRCKEATDSWSQFRTKFLANFIAQLHHLRRSLDGGAKLCSVGHHRATPGYVILLQQMAVTEFARRLRGVLWENGFRQSF